MPTSYCGVFIFERAAGRRLLAKASTAQNQLQKLFFPFPLAAGRHDKEKDQSLGKVFLPRPAYSLSGEAGAAVHQQMRTPREARRMQSPTRLAGRAVCHCLPALWQFQGAEKDPPGQHHESQEGEHARSPREAAAPQQAVASTLQSGRCIPDQIGDKTGDKRKTNPARQTKQSRQG